MNKKNIIEAIITNALFFIACLIGIIILSVIDLKNPPKIVDWLQQNPLITGLLINFLSISLPVGFVYKKYREREEAKLWNKVWTGILRETGFQCTLFIEGMDYLLSGRHIYNIDSVFSEKVKDQVQAILSDHGYFETQDAKMGDALDRAERRKRLENLLTNEKWQRWVCRCFDILKHNNYITITNSIQLMLQSDALKSQCNILGYFMNKIEDMHTKLDKYTFSKDPNIKIEDIIRHWDQIVLLGIATHTIQIQAYDSSWLHWGRVASLDGSEKKVINKILDEMKKNPSSNSHSLDSILNEI
jgi:hypothetical protein